MDQTKTLRLLILNDSLSEAERLISMLHNAGRPARAQHVNDEETLSQQLQEKSWDLMIGHDSTQNLPPAAAIRTIRRFNKDIPLILLTDREGTYPIVEGMKMGAVDVVQLDEDQHLLQVIQREMDNIVVREQRRFAERRFRDIERRNQQLLDSSRDAIAFVQDGMFLYINDSFAEMLGFENSDELDCMPVIDITNEKDQLKVKKFLKDFMLKGSEIETIPLEFNVILGDGSERPVTFDVCKSNYDDEMCIQFVVHQLNADTQELEAQLEQIKYQDLATGLYNKAYLVEALQKSVDRAGRGTHSSALFHIGIDDFLGKVKSKLGVASVDVVLATIANQTKTLIPQDSTLCRYAESSFMLLCPKIEANKALTLAEHMCKELNNFIVDIDNTTVNFRFGFGIALINETTASSDEPINQSSKALEIALASETKEQELAISIYEPDAKEGSKQDIARQVQIALDKGRFKLLFQPILSLRGSEIEHYEVLLRMIDANGEDISPKEFLAEAAKIAATTKIDRWVILESVKLLSEHRGKGHDTRLIVNLSRESMLDATLPPWLSVAFKAAKLPTDAIIFQFNEIDVNDHLNVASAFTEQLQGIGCVSGVNRFGCALNPFNALNHIKSSYVKIDGSFTQELQKGNEDSDELNQLVSELHQQDKITIVPYVENASVLSKLWQSGVHYIQGYYLQGPTDAMDYDFDMES